MPCGDDDDDDDDDDALILAASHSVMETERDFQICRDSRTHGFRMIISNDTRPRTHASAVWFPHCVAQ